MKATLRARAPAPPRPQTPIAAFARQAAAAPRSVTSASALPRAQSAVSHRRIRLGSPMEAARDVTQSDARPSDRGAAAQHDSLSLWQGAAGRAVAQRGWEGKRDSAPSSVLSHSTANSAQQLFSERGLAARPLRAGKGGLVLVNHSTLELTDASNYTLLKVYQPPALGISAPQPLLNRPSRRPAPAPAREPSSLEGPREQRRSLHGGWAEEAPRFSPLSSAVNLAEVLGSLNSFSFGALPSFGAPSSRLSSPREPRPAPNYSLSNSSFARPSQR